MIKAVKPSNLITYWNQEVFAKLVEKKLSTDEILILYCIYQDKITYLDVYCGVESNLDKYLLFQQLEVEGYILNRSENNNEITLTQKGEQTVEEFMNLWGINEYLTEKVTNDDSVFMENCIRYVQLFDKKNIGVTDKKCNANDIVFKMKKFFSTYPQYNWEDVLEGTRFKIEEMRRENRLKYLQKANYFIFKRTELTKDSEVSTLVSAIEEYKDNTTETENSLLNDTTI